MNEQKNDNKLSDIIKTSLDNIRAMVDANTVVGDPIATVNGTTIIPVSKLTVAFASGGVDYLGKRADAQNAKNMNFGGGGGTGLNVIPVAFLIIAPDGSVEMQNINQPAPAPSPADPATQIISLIERSPELIEKVKSIFTGAKKADEE